MEKESKMIFLIV